MARSIRGSISDSGTLWRQRWKSSKSRRPDHRCVGNGLSLKSATTPFHLADAIVPPMISACCLSASSIIWRKGHARWDGSLTALRSSECSRLSYARSVCSAAATASFRRWIATGSSAWGMTPRVCFHGKFVAMEFAARPVTSTYFHDFYQIKRVNCAYHTKLVDQHGRDVAALRSSWWKRSRCRRRKRGKSDARD